MSGWENKSRTDQQTAGVVNTVLSSLWEFIWFFLVVYFDSKPEFVSSLSFHSILTYLVKGHFPVLAEFLCVYLRTYKSGILGRTCVCAFLLSSSTTHREILVSFKGPANLLHFCFTLLSPFLVINFSCFLNINPNNVKLKCSWYKMVKDNITIENWWHKKLKCVLKFTRN